VKDQNDFLAVEQLVEKTIGADSATPDVLLSLHFLDVSEKWIAGQKLNRVGNPARVLFRQPSHSSQDVRVNLQDPGLG